MLAIEGFSVGKYSSKRGNINTLAGNVEKNYQAVENYFQQKKIMFLQTLLTEEKKREQITEDAFLQAMNDLIITKWKNLDLRNESKYSNFSREDFQQIGFSDRMIDELINHPDRKWFSSVGFAYEIWLEEALQGIADTIADTEANEILSGLSKNWGVVGDVKVESALRSKSSIRPDLGNMKFNEKNNPELQVAFDVSQNRFYNKSNKAYEITEQALDNLKQYDNMFGFSVKTWTGGIQGNKITGSSLIKDVINTVYRGSYPHTWNLQYAYYTMLDIISRYLLNILGPVNVALIMGDKIMFMDELLRQSYLVSHIYSKMPPTINNEGLPYVQSGNIYLRQRQSGKGFLDLTSSTMRIAKGEHKQYWELRFSIK